MVYLNRLMRLGKVCLNVSHKVHYSYSLVVINVRLCKLEVLDFIIKRSFLSSHVDAVILDHVLWHEAPNVIDKLVRVYHQELWKLI